MVGGQGFTSEALSRLICFFFEEVKVNRIESRHDPRNPNSGKVMMKCGLKHEGGHLDNLIGIIKGFVMHHSMVCWQVITLIIKYN